MIGNEMAARFCAIEQWKLLSFGNLVYRHVQWKCVANISDIVIKLYGAHVFFSHQHVPMIGFSRPDPTYCRCRPSTGC